MANFETEITLDVLDLVYSLPKQKQIKLIKELLSNLDSNELNDVIPQNNADNDRINFLNKELNTNYKSLDKVDWDYISEYQKLSEEFIREFKDKLNWDKISAYQILSEDFIMEFQDKVNWENILFFQKLSKDFKREFEDRIK